MRINDNKKDVYKIQTLNAVINIISYVIYSSKVELSPSISLNGFCLGRRYLNY